MNTFFQITGYKIYTCFYGLVFGFVLLTFHLKNSMIKYISILEYYGCIIVVADFINIMPGKFIIRLLVN